MISWWSLCYRYAQFSEVYWCKYIQTAINRLKYFQCCRSILGRFGGHSRQPSDRSGNFTRAYITVLLILGMNFTKECILLQISFLYFPFSLETRDLPSVPFSRPIHSIWHFSSPLSSPILPSTYIPCPLSSPIHPFPFSPFLLMPLYEANKLFFIAVLPKSKKMATCFGFCK